VLAEVRRNLLQCMQMRNSSCKLIHACCVCTCKSFSACTLHDEMSDTSVVYDDSDFQSHIGIADKSIY
jgi:hypothetical protein